MLTFNASYDELKGLNRGDPKTSSYHITSGFMIEWGPLGSKETISTAKPKVMWYTHMDTIMSNFLVVMEFLAFINETGMQRQCHNNVFW